MTSLDDTEFVVRSIAVTTLDNEKYFGDLDSVVGDGDFGYSLARGFEQVIEHWDDFDRDDPGAFLLKVAMTISSRIGEPRARSGAPRSCASARLLRATPIQA
jgi:hypothetical protein